jgi:DNA mismatch endonuclease (patch repair protein)
VTATSDAVRKSMQGNKRKDTKPELKVRALLRELGFPGYRLQWKKAPGHPDIAYPGRKIAIFVHGCFWHHHEGCHYATMPASNTEFWQAKFERNRQRDERVTAQLEAEGWKVIVIWECELKGDAMARTGEYLYSVLSV